MQKGLLVFEGGKILGLDLQLAQRLLAQTLLLLVVR